MDLTSKYNYPVPRYTSYPTATQFTPDVNSSQYSQWLSVLSGEDSLSLYLHVPFCHRLCRFCGCHTKIVTRYDPIHSYVKLLVEEIKLVSKILPKKMPVQHIHFGGGSPTILKSYDFSLLMTTLRQNFSVSEEAEIAVEIEPRSTQIDIVSSFAKEGVNRVSLGIQDFTPKVQQAIDRVQSYDETKHVVSLLREHGIGKVNFDLMYGLPFQTTCNIVNTIELAIKLVPHRIALFGYAHVPWMKPHQRLITNLPDAHARVVLYQTAADRLVEKGFFQIGLDHFAHPKDSMVQAYHHHKLHRNFLGYTTDSSSVLLGFGASAIGRLPQGYVQNVVKDKDYRKAVEAGILPCIRGKGIDKNDLFRGEIIEHLMCYLEVDLEAICQKYGETLNNLSQEIQDLKTMQQDGLLQIDGNRVVVNKANRYLIRVICSVFDEYFEKIENRYSASV